MAVRKYFGKFYLFSLFIILFSNLLVQLNADEIRKNEKFSNIYSDKIKWKKIKGKENLIKKLKWEKYYPGSVFEESENDLKEDLFQNRYEDQKKQLNTKEFLYLGFAVPDANVMNKNDFMIYAEQLFPFYTSDLEEGTANQNYSVFLSYGLNDRIMLTGFFSHSDDPLYNKINNVEKQPANKWISIGLGSRLNLFRNYKFSTSLDTSIESWYIKSGGCNGIGCEGDSSNIFDKSLNEFKNTNLIGSIALPTTFKISKKTNFVFSPKLTFLPEEQKYKTNSGSFYGFNSGIGLGFSHELTNRFHIYTSSYIPLKGENYFDENITFKKAVIYDLGFSYILDPKISFQSYLTNSFGATPATGILTIPSDNNLIFGTRLIYKPTSLDFVEKGYTKKEYKFEGLSVTNSGIIQPNKTLVDISLDKEGNTWTSITTGLSRSFNFEINVGKSSNFSNIENKYFNEYIGSDLYNLRFGGKAILINQNEYFPISSGIRMTFGRSLGETWPGYLFIENTNTKIFSKRIKFNITPKIAWTSLDNPSALGTSLIFDINDNFSIIFERNNALRNAESNFTSALRFTPKSNRYIDLYLTDAVSFTDIGELINAKQVVYGLKFGFKF